MILGIYFSPCGSTKTAVTQVCQQLSEKWDMPYRLQSYTLPHERDHWQPIQPHDIVVWGTPTYAGRIPNKTLDFITRHIIGHNNPVALLCTFGNRSSDHTLEEMLQLIDQGNMHAIGFASIATAHVFAPQDIVPPENDDALIHWTNRLNIHTTSRYPTSHRPLPYYTPLKADGTPAKFLKSKPTVSNTRCTGCGHCAPVCPTGVIHMADNQPQFADPCIKCQACIKGCPCHALEFLDTDFLSHVEMLKQNCTQPGFTFFHALE